MPATWGSRALAGSVPRRDELPVARLRAAGAVIVGKTNVPELTLEGYTRNDLFGVTRNPWDTRLTPGGSSGGAAPAWRPASCRRRSALTAAARSAGPPATPVSSAGSHRPARIPRIDGFPAILTDFETIGTLTRTVDDAMLLDSAMAGPDPRDRRSLYAAAQPRPDGPMAHHLLFRSSAIARSIPKWPRSPPAWQRLSAREGHRGQEERVFFDLEDAARIWHVISRAGVAWLIGREDGQLGAMAGASVRAMAADGAKLTGADYIDALERVAAFRRRCAELFAEDRFRSHADGRRLAVAGCHTVSGSDRGSAGRPPRSCRVHRLGEHRRPSSDQPAGGGLATRPADRRSVRGRVRRRLRLARIRP